MEWFAVRHVIENDGAFEERVTVWHAQSEDDAIRRAEPEAAEYAALGQSKVLDLFQCFRLADAPADGREVFSLIRRSDLPVEEYLDTFFDTGTELQRTT
jgi:hypothetical protein